MLLAVVSRWQLGKQCGRFQAAASSEQLMGGAARAPFQLSQIGRDDNDNANANETDGPAGAATQKRLCAGVGARVRLICQLRNWANTETTGAPTMMNSDNRPGANQDLLMIRGDCN